MSTYIGLDIGGTNLRLGVVANGVVIEEMRLQANFSAICKQHTADVAWQQILDITASLIKSALRKHPAATAVGIGFPGFIDPLTQTIIQSPNLPGLANVNLGADLAAIINLPVIVENDALAAAYGEFRSVQASVAQKNMLYIGLGTGVGGGLILNGKPFGGEHGMAMEVGHIITVADGRLCGCGNYGCMEQYASASGVALSYAELTGVNTSADAIATLARNGDLHALQAYSTAAINLALACTHMVKILDISLILIGGGMSQAWDLLSPSFQRTLDDQLIPVSRTNIDLKLSTSGDQAGIIGAALLSA
jgi:glucokinase